MTEQTPAQDLFTGLDAPEGEVPDAPEPAADPAPVDTAVPADDSAPAPAAAAAATPTPAAEGTAAPVADPAAADKAHDRTVPLAVHLEERKQYREELASLRAELAEIRKGSAPQPEQPAAPATEDDYFKDPKGYTDARAQAVLDRLEALEKTGTERLSAIDQRTQAAELDRQLTVAQETFAKSVPDFVDALNHVRTVRIQQIRLSNPGVTDDQIRAHILNDERQVSATLIAQGRNPAEYVYQLAKVSGYTRGAQAPAAASSPAPSNGAAAGTVPADVTLNRTPGQAPPGPEEGNDGDEDNILEQARTERFRKRA